MTESDTEIRDKILIDEISHLTKQISSRNLCSIPNLEKYARSLEKYETIKPKYESGDLFDLSPLENFSNHASILSDYVDNLLSGFNRLSDIKSNPDLPRVKESLLNIDSFFSKLELLHHLMLNKNKSSWYKKLNTEISIIDSSLKSTSATLDVLTARSTSSDSDDISALDPSNDDSNIRPFNPPKCSYDNSAICSFNTLESSNDSRGNSHGPTSNDPPNTDQYYIVMFLICVFLIFMFILIFILLGL